MTKPNKEEPPSNGNNSDSDSEDEHITSEKNSNSPNKSPQSPKPEKNNKLEGIMYVYFSSLNTSRM